MSLLDVETKIFVRRDPIPTKCGPNCDLYDLASHMCIVSVKSKIANDKCDYPADQIQNIIDDPKAVELLKSTFQAFKLP